MPLLNIIKIFQIGAQEFGLEIRSGEMTRKKNKEMTFLHVILLLDLIYVPTKYYQIISNSIGVMACTRSRRKRKLSLLHPFWSLSMSLPNIIKIFQTIKKL